MVVVRHVVQGEIYGDAEHFEPAVLRTTSEFRTPRTTTAPDARGNQPSLSDPRRRAVRADDLENRQLLHPLHARANRRRVRPGQAGKTVQEVLGFGGALPVVAISSGPRLGATAVLIGIGRWAAGCRPMAGWLRTAIGRGLEIWSGLHTFIGDDPELGALARAGVRIFDARRPPANLPSPMGSRPRSTHTSCTPWIRLQRRQDDGPGRAADALIKRGHRTRFVATGQTASSSKVGDRGGRGGSRLHRRGVGVAGARGGKRRGHHPRRRSGSLIHRDTPGDARASARLVSDALILSIRRRATTSATTTPRALGEDPSAAGAGGDLRARAAPVRPTKVIGICLNTFDMSEVQARRRSRVLRTRPAAGDRSRPLRLGPLVEAIVQGRWPPNKDASGGDRMPLAPSPRYSRRCPCRRLVLPTLHPLVTDVAARLVRRGLLTPADAAGGWRSAA